MIKINRRKFMATLGLTSLGGIPLLNSDKSRALDLTVNQFDQDLDININNISSITIKIKNMIVEAENVDTSKDAKLKIFGKIEDNDIGKIEQISNINVKELEPVNVVDQVESDKLSLELEDGTKYKDEYLSEESYLDKDSIDITIRFELTHPSLNKTIEEKVDYQIGFLSGNFTVSDPAFDSFTNRRIRIASNSQKTTSSQKDIYVWGIDDKFKKFKKLMSGGAVNNKSSHPIPNGFIDVETDRFDYSTRDNPNTIYDAQFVDPTPKPHSSSLMSDVWSINDKFKKFKKLMSGGAVNNKSSYSVPNGFMDVETDQFDSSTRNNEDTIYDEKLKSPENEDKW